MVDTDPGSIEALFEGLGIESNDPPVTWPEDTPLYVDDREVNRSDRIVQMLTELSQGKYPVEVRRLEDEDYLVGDVHVTRKTWPDFIASYESGHLMDELARILLRNRRVKMILERGVLQFSSQHVYGRLKGAIDPINEVIPIKETPDLVGTAEYLTHLRARVVAGRFGTVRRKPIIYPHPSDLVTFYAALPGIGVTSAEQLAERYPTPAQLYDAVRKTHLFDPKKYKTKVRWRTRRWDAGVKGIGEGRAEGVASFLLDGKTLTKTTWGPETPANGEQA